MLLGAGILQALLSGPLSTHQLSRVLAYKEGGGLIHTQRDDDGGQK